MSWLTMRQESDCFLLPRKTILVVSHASRCNSWSFIPRKRLTRPMGWVLHTCTYVGNLPIDIPLFSKLAPSVSPQSWRNGKYANCEELWVLIWQRGQDGLLLFKKEIPRLRDVVPIRENAARGFWSARLHARALYYTVILGRGDSINKPCGRKVSERLRKSC